MRGQVFMGLRPKPHSRTFLPKSPRDPKKPNCIGFRLSSIDSEQGCRRQPCFLFGADSTAPAPTPRAPAMPRRIRRHLPRRSLPAVPPALPLRTAHLYRTRPHRPMPSPSTAHTSVPLARLATRTRRSPCCAHSFTRRSYRARRAHPAVPARSPRRNFEAAGL